MTGIRKKRKLLVVLGAGSSMPCGMPSVREIDVLMKQWSRDWTDKGAPFRPISCVSPSLPSNVLPGGQTIGRAICVSVV
jgi:hypothetical protein